MSEAQRKRAQALDAAGAAVLVASTPATVRWLLCGRGRPVEVASVDYTVVLREGAAFVLFKDIERSRVESEERFEELGYEPVPYPWFEGPDAEIARLAGGDDTCTGAELEQLVAESRRTLGDEERKRYRMAGAEAAASLAAVLGGLRPEQRELDVAAALASEAFARGFWPRVVLVAGARRQAMHRHPTPTAEQLGRHALLAVTLERDGLHVSLTRIVSFGPPPAELARAVDISAAVDAALLTASRPGVTLGELFHVLADAYEQHGRPEEWRRHHQGGIAGYKGREVFATPGDATELPASCAVAWNPSVTGGGKSEDTALVSADGVEILTRTRELGELQPGGGVARPAIVEL